MSFFLATFILAAVVGLPHLKNLELVRALDNFDVLELVEARCLQDCELGHGNVMCDEALEATVYVITCVFCTYSTLDSVC